MKNQSHSKKLGECFNILYNVILGVRVVIVMHARIGKVSSLLKHQYFWGFLQQNLFLKCVINDLFSICKPSTLKSQIMNLLDNEEKLKLNNALCKLNDGLKEHKEFRSKYLAHKSKKNYHGKLVDYKEILKLLNKFEIELDAIIKNTDILYIKPSIKPANDFVIRDLKQILDADLFVQNI